MTKHHDQGNLENKHFIVAHDSRGLESITMMVGNMAAVRQAGAEAVTENLHQAEKASWE